MNALVRPATSRDVDAVAEFLHEHMDSRLPARVWRRILDYPWRPPGVERGWLVEAEGAVVGFMATIYSDRPTSTGIRRFCDLGAWYLLRPFRGTGVGEALLKAGMSQPGVTYATMTARAATGRRIRALGWQVLDARRRIFRPGRPSGALRRVDPQLIAWPPAQSRILSDHRQLNLMTLAITGEDAPVLLICHRKRKGADVDYHDMLHCSDIGFLNRNAQAIADLVVAGDNGVFAVDHRFLRAGRAEGEDETLPLARWFRPAQGILPFDIDHLYSETLLLDRKLP